MKSIIKWWGNNPVAANLLMIDLLSHSKKHDAYSEQITEFCRASLHGKSEVPYELLDFLTNWWNNHILHEDMQYKAFFEAKGVR